ncbi:hypothetical protein LP316_05435 [Thalassotalea sp. LPB0316]|uniref:hypothetical protein n=1 Tax=Thalassotalea sp. LPB0316 TaxID=2769490 RepID=UPI00186607C9|nr:hypothetical protein [Thalassotalea sp. LPB0316]QOL26742.1 hypothetical protein LP316_05435 [Thalassotalea sp. LPB0316]
MFKTTVAIALLFSWNFAALASVDPTKPLSGAKQSSTTSSQQSMVLQSIMTIGGVNKAIVSGKLVQKGDTIGQYRVISVEKKLVKLASSDGQMTLKLFAESVKK